MQEILDKFKFRNQIDTMTEAGILGAVIEKFVAPTVNLSPESVLDDRGNVWLPGLDNHTMGTIFEEGPERSNIKAVRWYSRAAEQGVAAAQTRLADMYYRGRGVARSLEKAVYWYRMGAEGGDPSGESALGRMYLEGEGVQQSYERALTLLKAAAEQNEQRARDALVRMYREGIGVERNDAEAARW